MENGGATPQGKFFAKDWNTLVEAVKQLDLAEFDEAALNKYLKDNGYITSDDIPSTDLSNLVTLSTEQTVTGPKDFTGGIKVNGQPLIYNAELGVWELTGDLLVTGNVAWFASIKGFKPSTIMDAVQVDGESIVINERGQLKAIGGGSGGSGGGLTVSDLSNYLTTNKYTKQSDVETLISTALTPYALTAAIPTNNNQLSNGAGYITAAALNGYAKTTDIPSLTGYATEQWVGDNYQPIINSTNKLAYSLISGTPTKLSQFTDDVVAGKYVPTYGGVISGTLSIDSSQTSDMPLLLRSRYADANGANRIQFVDGNNQFQGYVMAGWGHLMLSHKTYNQIGVGGDLGVWYSNDNGNTRYQIIHSGNIGSYNAGSATKLATPRAIWGKSFDGTGNIDDVLKINGADILWSDGKAISSVGTSGFTLNLEGSLVVASERLAVGRATADAKFHVGGAAKIDSSLFVGNKQSSLHVAWLSYSGICATGSGLSGWLAEFGNGTQGVLLGCRGSDLSVASIGTVNATDLSLLPDGGPCPPSCATASTIWCRR